MKKWKPDRLVQQKTISVLSEEDWQKALAHGHFCPYCKSEVLQYDNCEVVYIIPNGLTTQAIYGFKRIFCQANRKVCCKDCVEYLREMARDDAFYYKHVAYVKSYFDDKSKCDTRGRVKRLPIKKGDNYRSVVMKMNGLDPKTMVQFVVYDKSDRVGEAKGTFIEPWLTAIYKHKAKA